MRAMSQRRNDRSGLAGVFSTKEAVMTMQTGGPKRTGFLQNTAEQVAVTAVALIAIILLVWRYLF